MKHYPSLKTLVGSAAVIALLALSLMTSLCGYDAKTMNVEAMNEDTTTDIYECNTLENGTKVYCDARMKNGVDFIQCPYYEMIYHHVVQYGQERHYAEVTEAYRSWSSEVFGIHSNYTPQGDTVLVKTIPEHRSEPRLVHETFVECEGDGGYGGTCVEIRRDCSDLAAGGEYVTGQY